MSATACSAARRRELIDALGLVPHPEGGFFREIHRTAATVISPSCGLPRNCLTDIYFLLAAGQESRFHRVLHDELWHFYEGAPLQLFEFDARSNIGPQSQWSSDPTKRTVGTIIAADYPPEFNAAQFIRKARQRILDFGRSCPVVAVFRAVQEDLLTAGRSP